MAKARVRQKEGIVKPQVVAGREFKGTAFISKPDKIIFKVSMQTPLVTARDLLRLGNLIDDVLDQYLLFA